MLKAASVKAGDVHEATLVGGLTRTQIVQYAGASGDFNPLHTDEVFMQKVAGYPSVFAHGMLTMAMTGRLLTGVAGPENLVRFGARFRAQVWPGDTLAAKATVDAVREEAGATLVDLTLSTVNQRGEEVLSGYATVRAGS
ncbi:MAG: MaoC/PaaZ C-terminal domain-containing protein [Micromonosporaceae bacterium]